MRIGFQGEAFSYSDQASSELFPADERIGYPAFVAAFEALRDGDVDLLVLPIENSTTGSVLPVLDRLLPGKVHIIGEHMVEVRHCLLAPSGATLDTIEQVHSHPEALSQAEAILTHRGWIAMPEHDTAGAVRLVAERNDPAEAALGPERAAEPNGLKVLMRQVVDRDHNTTRFVVLARQPVRRRPGEGPLVTTFVFRVRNVPAALYKALGGFATNGVNITKLESYMINGSFEASQFYADVEGHPDDRSVKLALEELAFFSHEVRLMGTYPADPFRFGGKPL
jgi:prephenate dehydratase